jgi:hypothetical protein
MKITLFILFCLSTDNILGQEIGKYNSGNRTGCLVWCKFPKDSVVWTGGCKNKTADGVGTAIWYDQGKETERFNGFMVNGKANGKGKYSNAWGWKFEGNFVDGDFINLNIFYLPHLKKNNVALIDSTNIYIGDKDHNFLFYHALVPKAKPKGVLVIFPGTGEPTSLVFSNNVKLIETAFDKNILVIIPSINNNLYIDKIVLNAINSIFSDILKKYNPPQNKIVISGLSLGGMNAIRYTEMAFDSTFITTIKPVAVLGIDPPVDLTNLYYTFSRAKERKFSVPAVNEAKDYLNKMHQQLGGTPDDFPDSFSRNSMFSNNKIDGGNSKYLKNIPIRIYSDPDIEWYMKNRNVSVYDMNILDQSAMIKSLNKLGNSKAEIIFSLGKGYRMDGNRHPHSWSIVEPTDCITWIIKCLE